MSSEAEKEAVSASSGFHILIIDDEIQICKNCVKILSRLDCEAAYALNGQEAMQMMAKTAFDIIITDLKMNRMGGMEVLSRVAAMDPDILVIVITGFASVSSAVEVMKLGAFDYLPKPFTPDELRAVVEQAMAERKTRLQNRKLQYGAMKKSFSHQLIGKSPKIKTVIEMIRKVAPTDSTVLVNGESGTGKELVARAIHANSNRRDQVFFAVDCGALVENLLESELFGHEKGAFTGAERAKPGILQLADRGTVFLDEIGNISFQVQAKLLRFLETREFLPLGGTSVRKVDIRLILATNQDLKQLVADGIFREDFYYRIFVYPILMPPLRERKSDILPIAYHFLHQYARKMGKPIKGFDPAAANQLTEYEWPGNVRQLKNVIERVCITCESEWITSRDLPFLNELDRLIDRVPTTNEELKQLKKEVRQKAVDKIEKDFLLNALYQNDWNVTRAAEKVGLQRTNFQGLMKKHQIRLPQKK